LERVSETLHAAALDEEAREAVGEACLERELRHVGLGALGAVSVTRPEPKHAEPERAERLKVARRAEADARRDLERARRALEDAQNRRDRAAAALQGAEEELARARERAEQAAAIHDRAQRTLDEL